LLSAAGGKRTPKISTGGGGKNWDGKVAMEKLFLIFWP
jgi:hypothetical protein